MLTRILLFGAIAGVIVGTPLFAMTVTLENPPGGAVGMAIGYLTMLVALSAVFLAVKQQRDRAGGGVIRFWPAFGMGLAVSIVAGVFYVAAWELALAVSGADYIAKYTADLIAQAEARGAAQAEIDKIRADMAAFAEMYANPLYRMPITFTEIFPVGVLVSLVSAALLRNSRFLPARPAGASA